MAPEAALTASLRGLLVCTALLLALALAWVLGDAAPLPSPRLWSIDPSAVSELRWLGPGDQDVVVRQRDGAWWVEGQGGGLVRAGRIEDLLGALAAARWHRRAQERLAGVIDRRVIIGGVEVGVGQALGEQRWLVIRGHALLVDGWLVRLLEAEDLREQAPFPAARRAPVVEIHGGAAPWRAAELVLQGARRVSPSPGRLEPARAEAVRSALAALSLTFVPAAPAAPSPAAAAPATAPWSVRVAGGADGDATLQATGACPGRAAATAVSSSRLGAGCVEDAALATLAAAVDAAAAPDALDPRPAGAEASELQSVQWVALGASVGSSVGAPSGSSVGAPSGSSVGAPSGSSVDAPSGSSVDARPGLLLERTGGSWRGQQTGAAGPVAFAVDPSAVERVVGALTTRWQHTPGGPLRARAEITVRHRDGSQERLLWGSSPQQGSWIQRAGEPSYLVTRDGADLSPQAVAIAVADPTLWQLELSEILSLSLDGAVVQRGAVLGEWLDARGAALPAPVAAAVERFLSELATLRASSRRPGVRAAHRGHRVRLTVAAAPAQTTSAPSVRTLELVTERRRCLGRVSGALPSPSSPPSQPPSSPQSSPSTQSPQDSSGDTSLHEAELPPALCSGASALASALANAPR